ncbi:uncharacterized protein [Epargyreus clarus]|uniref:uncharacterized protein n=1 Tax=Epargyreus clarus TaxID=520877 RepID=UPI003C2D2CCA
MLAKYELADRLWPMLALVGGLEIIVGTILTTIMVLYGNDYDELYGTEESRGISQACLSGSMILWITACMLLISIHWKIRRLMLVYVFISTILGVYIFILSVIKMQYGLSLIEKDSSVSGCGGNQNFLSSAPCLLGLLTLLGSAIHFIGNIIVFTYYNLKFIQPCMIKCNDTI